MNADQPTLLQRFGSAKQRDATPERTRPDGVGDDVVDALGLLSKALETAEDARGHLYAFHRLSGRADLDLQEALTALRQCGQGSLADEIDEVLVGRGVVGERWTFQLVEAYDAGYLDVFRASERHARDALGVPRHLAEAEMQADEQQRSG